MSYYTEIILVGAHWFRVSFPKLQTFSGIFWGLFIDYSLCEKTMLGIFVDLFICEVTTADVNFRFYKVKSQHVLFVNEPFLRKILLLFFSSIISLYIERNPKERSYEVLRMELKMYIPVGPKFVFEKIKFYIIFNMISFPNVQVSVKIRLACSKVFLLIN